MMVDMDMAHSTVDVHRWSAEESSVAFDSAIVQLFERLKAGRTRTKGRWMEMLTLYNHTQPLRQERKRKRQAEKREEESRVQRAAVGADEAGSGAVSVAENASFDIDGQ